MLLLPSFVPSPIPITVENRQILGQRGRAEEKGTIFNVCVKSQKVNKMCFGLEGRGGGGVTRAVGTREGASEASRFT